MANKKAFQAPPPAGHVQPRPRPLPPPPYPEPAPEPEPEPEPAEIDYPSSDGKPPADNTWQARTMHEQFGMLSTRYKDDPNTVVAMALLLYYTEGEPADVAAPDLFVARGVPNRLRDWYKVWEEGKAPDFALEVSSAESAEDNLGRNMETYARIGIREYCVYDPKGGLHSPRLQLFRLAGGAAGVYERVRAGEDPDGSLAVPSEALGLELRFEEDRLRLWDPATQQYLLEHAEERAGRLEERSGRMRERAGRLEERSGRMRERAGRMRERSGRMRERSGRMRERSGRLEERSGRMRERSGRLEERSGRIAAEQRVRELELKVAAIKERL